MVAVVVAVVVVVVVILVVVVVVKTLWHLNLVALKPCVTKTWYETKTSSSNVTKGSDFVRGFASLH